MGKKGGKGGKVGKAGLPSFIPRPPACLTQLAEENFDGKKAEEEAQFIQNRLREILVQVWDENAIFQRIMYKNQNQHRRTVYFRRLMQVRRDLSLLESFQLNDVVEALSHCVSFSKAALPKAVLDLLGQGVQSKDQLISIIQRRLLGAARLLQLMADPILNAGLAIEGLLSQSFFMPFALTVLALLARFRMLLIKALYEMIAAFNLVSAGVTSVWPDVPLLLECKWDGVKLIFFEKAPPPPLPQELIPLPPSLSDAAKLLPDVGWFIDDRSTTSAVPKPLLYEREESFILEESEFELPGEEAAAVPLCPAMEAKTSSGIQEMEQSFSTDAVSIPSSSKEAGVSLDKQKSAQGLRKDVRAKLESWKAELESWGSTKKDKNSKKRVAYVSVELGRAKESKILNTGHPR